MNDFLLYKTPPHYFSYATIKKLFKQKSILFGSVFLLILILCSILFPLFSNYSYYETALPYKNMPPSTDHWFGTDDLGRDMFVRIWYGARITLFIGIAAAVIDMFIGVIYGAFAGYIGKNIDTMMMRSLDIINSIPRLIIIILLMVLLGQGISTIILAMTITGWTNMARIVRSHILQLKEKEFILSAKSMGASHMRILFYHLIPNAFGSIITTMTLSIPAAIFTETFLSFLGIGVPPPAASWGTMACDGLMAFRFYPWRLFFPALFISSTLLAFNVLGDGLRDFLDPRIES